MSKSSPANFTLYPLLWLAVCFAAGILIADFLFFGWQTYFITCVIFAILAGFFIKRKIVLIFLSIAFTAAGGLHLQVEIGSVAEHRLRRLFDEHRVVSGDPIEIEGVLQTKPELAVGGFFLILKTERAIYKNSEIKITGNVRFFAPTPNEQIKNEYARLNLNYGSRIRIACNPRREDNFLNPGVFSHKELLGQKQLDATAIVKSPLLVEKNRRHASFRPARLDLRTSARFDN